MLAWCPEKNLLLQRERGILFEDVVYNIEVGHEVAVFMHPNQIRYPGQKISVVAIEGYAFLLPYVESEAEIFLKTIIPSSKATKRFRCGIVDASG